MIKLFDTPSFSRIVIVFLLLAVHVTGFAIDSSKYIGIDEVRPGMEAYCLSVFSGTKVEKFNLEVLSVVRGFKPGQDMIVVMGTDERFRHSGTVHGCSGSSVFIDGRLAGALAAGWDESLDSLYLVRPIKDMLEVGSVETATTANAVNVPWYDFSQPLDLDAYYQQSITYLKQKNCGSQMFLPLSGSLPDCVFQGYGDVLKGMGFVPVAAEGGLPSRSFEEVGTYERGGVLSLVMCGGDISLAATGTVTEVIGDQVYGFGHANKGIGATELPMATGVIHVVVASRKSSFKFSSPGPVTGTLEFDQSCGVRGTIGRIPRTIPLRIEVDRYNDPHTKKYDCYLAVDKDTTPMILQFVLNGAAMMQGPMPIEHTIRYSGKIALEDGQAIEIEDVSSGRQITDVAQDFYVPVSLMLGNNPYGEVKIESIDVKMTLEPVNRNASIWAVDVDRTEVAPGETVNASVVLRSYHAAEQTVTIDLKVPETLRPGRYKMMIMGAQDYRSFVSKAAPQRFRFDDLASMKTALNHTLQYHRDGLYAVMPVPASGVVIHQHELGQLPPTKVLLMQDRKRIRPVESYNGWTENHTELDKIVHGAREIELTVKR